MPKAESASHLVSFESAPRIDCMSTSSLVSFKLGWKALLHTQSGLHIPFGESQV